MQATPTKSTIKLTTTSTTKLTPTSSTAATSTFSSTPTTSLANFGIGSTKTIKTSVTKKTSTTTLSGLNSTETTTTTSKEIEEISKKISEHADAIYRTWRERGLAPTELLDIYTNAATVQVGGDIFGGSVDAAAAAAESTTEGLQQFVNQFVIKDKEQRGVKNTNISSLNFLPSQRTVDSTATGTATVREINIMPENIGNKMTLKSGNVGNVLSGGVLKQTSRATGIQKPTATATSSSSLSSPTLASSSVASLIKSNNNEQASVKKLAKSTTTANTTASSTSLASTSSSSSSSSSTVSSLKNNACVKNVNSVGSISKQNLTATPTTVKRNFGKSSITNTAATTTTATPAAGTTTTNTTAPTLDMNLNLDLALNDLQLDVNCLSKLQTQNLIKIKELLKENESETINKEPKKATTTTKIATKTKRTNSPIKTLIVESSTMTKNDSPTKSIKTMKTANSTINNDHQESHITNNSNNSNSNNNNDVSVKKITKNLNNNNNNNKNNNTNNNNGTMANNNIRKKIDETNDVTTSISKLINTNDKMMMNSTPTSTTNNSNNNKIQQQQQTGAKATIKSTIEKSPTIKASTTKAASTTIGTTSSSSSSQPSISSTAKTTKTATTTITIPTTATTTTTTTTTTKTTNVGERAHQSIKVINSISNGSQADQQQSQNEQNVVIQKLNKKDKNKDNNNKNNINNNSNNINKIIKIDKTNNNSSNIISNNTTLATLKAAIEETAVATANVMEIARQSNNIISTNSINLTRSSSSTSSSSNTTSSSSNMPAPTKFKSGRAAPGAVQDKNLKSPFLTRGSVAERVLMFEKCPNVRNSFLNINRPDPNDAPPKSLLKAKLHATPPQPSEQRTLQQEIRSLKSVYIPRFYFPHGKPQPQIAQERILRGILGAFDSYPNNQVTKDELPRILKLCGLPFYWRMPVMVYCQQPNNIGLVERQRFVEFWKQMNIYCHDAASRFVYILSRGQRFRSYIIPEDMVPLVQDVVDTHPGLAFLKEATEFHSRYVHTVIARIFYSVNRSWSGKITMSELKKSDLLEIISLLEEEDDINQIMAFFSYEHFYVIYCKFWELDKDHDLLINQDDLARHSDHALSTRIVERIFSGCVTRSDNKKNANDEPKMSYTDFVWFLLSEEDKRTPTAIEYWFRCMDLDGDGVLSMYELEYFYEEQQQRMESIGIETLPFEDCLCQMLDMIKPQQRDAVSLGDLKRCKMTHVFFDTFFNLEKYLEHEQRDPFASQRDEYTSDWDRFAAQEYELLISEEND